MSMDPGPPTQLRPQNAISFSMARSAEDAKDCLLRQVRRGVGFVMVESGFLVYFPALQPLRQPVDSSGPDLT